MKIGSLVDWMKMIQSNMTKLLFNLSHDPYYD